MAENTEVQPQETKTELSADEQFNAAFADLTKPVEEPKVAGEAAPGDELVVDGGLPDPKKVTPQGEIKVEGAAAEAAAAAATAEAAAAEAAAAAAAAAPAEAKKPIEDVLRDLLGERQAAKPTPTPEPKKEPYKTPDYTADQKEVVDAYEREFPEMAKAEEIKRSREAHALSGYIFSQVTPHLEGAYKRIADLEGIIARMIGTQQAQTIESKVGNVAELKPKIEAWIKTQPSFMQPALTQIVEKGTTEEVVGLVNHYKEATKDPAVAAADAKAAAEAAKKAAAAGGKAPVVSPTRPVPTAVAPPAKKVPTGLRPVPSLRTSPDTATIAADDFDGAFAAFSKAGA